MGAFHLKLTNYCDKCFRMVKIYFINCCNDDPFKKNPIKIYITDLIKKINNFMANNRQMQNIKFILSIKKNLNVLLSQLVRINYDDDGHFILLN